MDDSETVLNKKIGVGTFGDFAGEFERVLLLTLKEAEIFEDANIKCILAARYGLDTSGMDFGYMQKLEETDLMTLRENLSSVCTGTKVVMDRVSSAFVRAEREKAQNAMPTGISALNDLFDKEDFQDKSAGKDDMEVA